MIPALRVALHGGILPREAAVRRHIARLRPRLSYSSFAYSGLVAERTTKGALVRVMVENTSARHGEEVVQLYVAGGPEPRLPLRSLRGFSRIALRAGARREVRFTLAAEDLPKAAADLSVGGGQPLPGVAFARATLPAVGR